jgi:hypothetical protein
MPGDTRPWNSKEWEKHVQRLLKQRYCKPPGTYRIRPVNPSFPVKHLE